MRLFILVMILLFTFMQTSYARELTARVDRSVLSQGETLQLILSINTTSFQNTPNLNPLRKDFEILNQSRSSRIQIVNGKRTEQTLWMLTIAPKHAGVITIPSLQSGKLSTKPLTIKVNKTNASTATHVIRSLYIEGYVDNLHPYVNSEVIYTLKIYSALSIFNADLQEPRISPEAKLIKLGQDVSYHTIKNGYDYQVIERRYAIFPQKSGKLTLSGAILSAAINDTSTNALFSRQKIAKRIAPEIHLNIKPIPQGFTHENWLPAKQVHINEIWSEKPVKFRVGEPVTRTLTIDADGVEAQVLPDLSHEQSPYIKQYPDKPQIETHYYAKGINGHREQKIAYVPTHAGPVTLPAIQIKWWNTKTNKPNVATIPARHINVASATLVSNTPALSSNLSLQQTKSINAPKTIIISQSIHHNIWFKIAGVLFVLWISTLLLWFSTRRNKTSSLKQAKPTDIKIKNSQLRSNIKKYCYANDPTSAQKSIIAWANQQWPAVQINNLGQLSNVIKDKKLAMMLDALDKHLYQSEQAQAWKGKTFWKVFNVIEQPKMIKEKKSLLPPLNP